MKTRLHNKNPEECRLLIDSAELLGMGISFEPGELDDGRQNAIIDYGIEQELFHLGIAFEMFRRQGRAT